MKTADSLPLRTRTPDAWGGQVLRAPLELLSDHAYLEKKAAANALELLNRWSEPVAPEHWLEALAAVARDETEHLSAVIRLLVRKGGALSRRHKNPYANELRALVRTGDGSRELVDRLLVSALIEARSCERFELLGRVCPDAELSRFYRRLWSSELNHYLLFLRLAGAVLAPAEVESRWSAMLDAEAQIIARQPPGPKMHGGIQPG